MATKHSKARRSQSEGRTLSVAKIRNAHAGIGEPRSHEVRYFVQGGHYWVEAMPSGNTKGVDWGRYAELSSPTAADGPLSPDAPLTYSGREMDLD